MEDNDENQEKRNGRGRGRGRPRGKRGRGNNKNREGYKRGNRGNRGNRYNPNYKNNNCNNMNKNFDRSNLDYEGNEDEDRTYPHNQQRDNNIKNHDYDFIHNDMNNQENKEQERKNNSNHKKEEKFFFSPNTIKDLEKKDIIDVITELNSDENFCKKINGTIFQKDICYSLMKTIKKVSEDNSEPVLILINKIIENTNFINKTIITFIKERNYDSIEYLNFFENFLLFLQKYLLISSKKLEININLYEDTKLLENKIKKEDTKEELKLAMKKVIQEINNYVEKNISIMHNENKEKEDNSRNKQKNQKNYKEIKTIINIDDFLTEVYYNIDPNIPKGKFDSYESYINTMFFLEYEDCYRNLRKAIYKLKNNYVSIGKLNKKEIKNFEKNQKDIYCYFMVK